MTFSSALPLLLKLAKREQTNAMLLGCAGVKHDVPAAAREVGDLDWSTCPLCLLRSPFWTGVRTLDRLLLAAPVTGWPDRFAPWAVAGVLYLRETR